MKVPYASVKAVLPSMFDLRMRIIQATKIIVTHEFLNFDVNYGDNIKQLFNNGSAKSIKEKIELHQKYARMPVPSMFIENDTGGMLVEQTIEGFTIISIAKDGIVHPFLTTCKGYQDGVDVPIVTMDLAIDVSKYDDDTVETMTLGGKLASLVNTLVALEVMLFMNIKNVTVHRYVPTKKENASVPKPLWPKYEYRVLDVFSDVVRYESLSQITEHLAGTARTAGSRRSSLVRGHFKEFKNGLFGKEYLAGLYWWNLHRRNRKNRNTVGEVEKDYRLVA